MKMLSFNKAAACSDRWQGASPSGGHSTLDHPHTADMMAAAGLVELVRLPRLRGSQASGPAPLLLLPLLLLRLVLFPYGAGESSPPLFFVSAVCDVSHALALQYPGLSPSPLRAAAALTSVAAAAAGGGGGGREGLFHFIPGRVIANSPKGPSCVVSSSPRHSVYIPCASRVSSSGLIFPRFFPRV